MGPAGVVKLVKAAITIDPINGDAEKQQPRAEPEGDSPRKVGVPVNGLWEVDQLL